MNAAANVVRGGTISDKSLNALRKIGWRIARTDQLDVQT
jgi:hypothetical protein